MIQVRNNYNSFKIISLLLCVVILALSFPMNVVASNEKLTYVFSYSSAMEEGFWLTLLNVDGTAYITSDDAAKISGLKKDSESDDKVVFSSGNHKVIFSGESESFNDIVYYDLAEVMDALSTSYKYDVEKETLYFNACESFYENLLSDCKEIYNERYDLAYIVNGWGVGVAAAYNIIGGFRFDFLWGGYQTEQYETALSAIINPESESKDVLDLISDGDDIMSKLSLTKKLNDVNKDDVKAYCEFLGYPFDEYVEAYNLINDAIPGLSVGDFIETIQNIKNAENQYELYVSAFKYGLVDNKNIKDGSCQTAINNIYSYYDKNKPTAEAVIKDVLMNIGSGSAQEGFKEICVEQLYGKNSIYVRSFKMVLDEFGMKNMTKAVEQTDVCSEIQKAAKSQFNNSQKSSMYATVDSFEAKGLKAKYVKYCTLLYLRAYQYAYELYEFDEDLKWCSETETERAQKAIDKISAYSDEDLARTVINKNLDLSQSGFCDEIKAFDASAYQGYWYTEGEYWVEFTIKSTNMNAADYDISFIRLYGFDNQTVVFDGDGFSKFKATDDYYYMEGTMLLENEKIKITISDSNAPYIKTGSFELTRRFSTSNESSTEGLSLKLYSLGEYAGKDDVTIELFPDYTFKMKINLYEGFGNCTGTYVTSSNGLISCTINRKDFYGFIGDELEKFSLTPLGNQKYQIDLMGVEYLGMLFDGDMFIKQ